MLAAVESREQTEARNRQRRDSDTRSVTVVTRVAGELASLEMTHDEWDVFWRRETVPPLCAMRARSMATSARPALPRSADAEERYGAQRVLWDATTPSIDEMLTERESIDPAALGSNATRETPTNYGAPLEVPRGWCARILGRPSAASARPSDEPGGDEFAASSALIRRDLYRRRTIGLDAAIERERDAGQHKYLTELRERTSLASAEAYADYVKLTQLRPRR